MASFESRAYLGGVPFRPAHEGVFTVSQTIVIPSGTALALNDKLYFAKLGENVVPLSMTLQSDDLDTGTTIVLDVGFEAVTQADALGFFIAGATIGQAGGVYQAENGGTIAYAGGAYSGYNEVVDIVGLVKVAPTGNPATNRKITLTMECVRANGSVPVLRQPYEYGAGYGV